MALTREHVLAKRPVDREHVEAHKANSLSEAQAYQLRDCVRHSVRRSRSSPSASAWVSGRCPRSSAVTSTALSSAPYASNSKPSAATWCWSTALKGWREIPMWSDRTDPKHHAAICVAASLQWS